MSPKFFENISHLKVEITPDVSNLSKEVAKNRLTDIKRIQNYLEIVYQSPENVSKKFQ